MVTPALVQLRHVPSYAMTALRQLNWSTHSKTSPLTLMPHCGTSLLLETTTTSAFPHLNSNPNHPPWATTVSTKLYKQCPFSTQQCVSAYPILSMLCPPIVTPHISSKLLTILSPHREKMSGDTIHSCRAPPDRSTLVHFISYFHGSTLFPTNASLESKVLPINTENDTHVYHGDMFHPTKFLCATKIAKMLASVDP